MSPQATLTVLALVFCPVWGWLWQRLFDGSDEPLGLLALATVVILVLARQQRPAACEPSSPGETTAPPEQASTATSTEQPTAMASAGPVAATPSPVLLLLCLYAVTFPWAPKLVQSLLCLLTIGAAVNALGGRFRLLSGDWLLLILTVPVIATLNFYVGFPLRVIVAQLASPLLGISGVSAIARGTALFSNGQTVEIDAPCSGVKMMWFAAYLGAAVSSFFGLGRKATFAVMMLSVIASITANVLRVTSLFYVEAGIVDIPAFAHDFVHQGIGVVAFAILGALILCASYALLQYDEERHHTNWLGAPPVSSASPPDKTMGIQSPGSQAPGNRWTGNQTPGNRALFLILCAIAAVVPILTFKNLPVTAAAEQSFPGWPDVFEGRALTALPSSKMDEMFAREFPGRLQAFTNGNRTVIMRWVTSPTRQLHPSSDCYKGLGYDIDWMPQLTDAGGCKWSVYSATKNGEKLKVRERIYDQEGNGWTDVSAWYWAASFRNTQPPWWTVTIVER